MSRDARLRLAFCGLHPDRSRALVAGAGSPAAALRRVEGGAVDVNDRVRAAAAIPAAARRAELAALGIEVAFRGDVDFPAHLADLPDAPDVLFLRGRLPPDPGVAVIGTRRCTLYGRTLATAYGVAIARAGWMLVSGLARGIDGAAHEGTAGASGRGVGVLGSGLDVMYPREHTRLAAALIGAGGAVISEYPPGTPPEGWRFPPRNRIISGLAAAVVVVEANVTGGALITANAALAHGVPVFAVPGDIDRPSSRGCNELIRDGAQPVFEADDLVEELSLVLGPPINRPEPGESAVEIGPNGISVERYAEQVSVPIGELMAHIARMEAVGTIRREGGRLYPGGP